MANNDGVLHSKQPYKPLGLPRYTSSILPAECQFIRRVSTASPHRICTTTEREGRLFFVSGRKVFHLPTRKRHFREIQWYDTNGGNLIKTQRSRKPVSSYRISAEGTRQLKELAQSMERSESNVIEIALDRMFREEVRFRYENTQDRTGSDQAISVKEHKERE